MNLNNNETEIPEDQLEEYALKLDAKDFACRSKAKAKPQRREPAGSSPRIVPIGIRNWIDIEPGKYSFSDYEVSKKVTFLVRHSQQMHREEDGAVHFWRMKEHLQSQFPQSVHWWKACLAAGGGENIFQNCIDPLDKSHKDLDVIDLSVPRHAQYLHNAWKRHQEAVYWVDINLAVAKGLKFYQTRSNAIILQETLPAYCIPEVIRMKTGKVLK